MTIFVVVCMALVVLAIFMLALPLLAPRPEGRAAPKSTNVSLYRDQFSELDADLRTGTLTAEHYDKARAELEARMLADVDNDNAPAAAASPYYGHRAAYILMIGLPLCAAALYMTVGMPGVFSPQTAANRSAAPHGTDTMQVEAMIDGLAARLKEDPSNGDGWAMLGRSYSSLSRYGEAAEAYKNAVARSAPDAQLLADYADALAMAQGRQLSGEPEKLVARALNIDGKNMKALSLAGTIAFEKRDYTAAINYWTRMRALVPGDSDEARAMEANIAEARELGGQAGAPAQARAPVPPPAKAALETKSAVVTGVARLAPEIAGKVSPTDTVFVFARAASGPPMPLAVLRKQVRDLPLTFSLDDTMAMMPAMKLSEFPKVIIGARISKAATATPQPGDFQGLSDAVGNNTKNVTVVISKEVR